MKYQIVLYLCVVLSVATFAKRQRILGGVDVPITEIPYHVSIRYYSSYQLICGGAIISESHVLTAAHGLKGEDNNIHRIRVFPGADNLIFLGHGLPIKSIIIHPNFVLEKSVEKFFTNDIAIVTLENPMRFNRYQNKVKLPTNPSNIGDSAIIAGWGMTNYPSQLLSGTLQKAPMVIQDSAECSRQVAVNIGPKQICAFQRIGIGACIGDSGGPLVSNGEIIGIASFVLPCATGIPDVYTRVHEYLDFILPIISA